MNYGINNLFPKPAVLNTGSPVLMVMLTVAGTAVSFPANAFDINTSLVGMDVQNADVYATYDGSTPSSSNGHHFYQGDKFTLSKAAAQALKMIQVSGAAQIGASQFSV